MSEVSSLLDCLKLESQLRTWLAVSTKPAINKIGKLQCTSPRVSIQGVKSLWGDCRFIPVDWGL